MKECVSISENFCSGSLKSNMANDNIIELRTGHVFVKGSVKSLSPFDDTDAGKFTVYGVGFKVTIEGLWIEGNWLSEVDRIKSAYEELKSQI